MTIEAMKQALEALETTSSYATAGWVEKAHREAITSLRQAIARAEQTDWTPLYSRPYEECKCDIDVYNLLACNVEATVFENQVAPVLLGNGFKPYVTTPREWAGLTDEEVADIERNSITRRQAIRAIEAKLKAKNFA